MSNKKYQSGKERVEFLKKLNSILPDNYLSNLADPIVYRQFCKEYAKKITPEIEAIDAWQARSFGRMFTKVIRAA